MRDEDLIQVCWGINCREIPYRIVKELNAALKRGEEYVDYQGLLLSTKITSQIPAFEVEYNEAYKKGWRYCKGCGVYSHIEDFEYGYIMCYDYIDEKGHDTWTSCKALTREAGKNALYFRKRIGLKPNQRLLPSVEKRILALTSDSKALTVTDNIDEIVRIALEEQDEEDRVRKIKRGVF